MVNTFRHRRVLLLLLLQAVLLVAWQPTDLLHLFMIGMISATSVLRLGIVQTIALIRRLLAAFDLMCCCILVHVEDLPGLG